MDVENTKNRTPNFFLYEWKRICTGFKYLYSKVRRGQSTTNETQTNKKVKEQGTFKTTWGLFKEAWHTTGKDFRKVFGFKVAESVVQGLGPYCQSFLFGSIGGLAQSASGAVVKFVGAAGLEIIRSRISAVCQFKGRIAQQVLDDTHKNATTEAVYADILHKPRPYFKDNAPAALSGVVDEITSAKNTLLKTSVECLSNAVVFGISSASLLAVNPKLAVAVLGTTVVAAKFGGYMNNIFRKFNSKVSSLGNRVRTANSDSIKNTPLVQETNRIDIETKLMSSRLDRFAKAAQKVKYAGGKGFLTMRSILNVAMQGAITVAAGIEVAKTGDIGRFALINMASWQMMGSGNILSELWTDMQAGTHKLIDATKKLVTPKELERVVGKEKLSENDSKIAVRNVSFAYPLIKDVTDMSMLEVMDREGEIRRTENILKDMSVEFDKGGVTAVVGTSGNGKSTLMSLIRHDYDPESGQIFIGDKEIRTISDEELNAQIAFVDQKVHFFDESIGYNLKYFKPDATEDELMEACRKAGFDADVEKFEDGLSHRIGQDGSKLSGGQQQRLALARAFLTDKPIVIMDEPTTGLDPKLSLRVVKALKDMAKEKTVIVVTHNPTEVALADRVVVVENGTVTADGKPMDLIQTSSFLRETLTKEDIKNKHRLYHHSVNGERPEQAVAEIVNAEARGKVLSDAERMKKRQLLEAHRRAFVSVRKNALESEREKAGKPLPQKKEKDVAVKIPQKQNSNGR